MSKGCVLPFAIISIGSRFNFVLNWIEKKSELKGERHWQEREFGRSEFCNRNGLTKAVINECAAMPMLNQDMTLLELINNKY